MSTLALAVVMEAAVTGFMISFGLAYLAYRRPAAVAPLGIALASAELMMTMVVLVVSAGTGG